MNAGSWGCWWGVVEFLVCPYTYGNIGSSFTVNNEHINDQNLDKSEILKAAAFDG